MGFVFFLTGELIAKGSIAEGFKLNWEVLTQIPPAKGQSWQPGLAGAFVGAHKDVLIIAGGANFPDGPAWEGGAKAYHSDIYVLEKINEEYVWFDQQTFSLPSNLAYGSAVSTEAGILCIGGMDGRKPSDLVFLIKWNPSQKNIEIEDLPVLPRALANLSSGKIKDHIYVAGSDEQSGQKYFWRINIKALAKGWEALPSWPGKARTHAVGIVQNNGEVDCFYLLKGRFRQANGVSELFSDGFCYNPQRNTWSAIGNRSRAEKDDFNISAATALAIGANNIFVFGGAEGIILNKIENLNAVIAKEPDEQKSLLLKQTRDSLMRDHDGFSRSIWSFHTITETWAKIGDLPSGSQVTTQAISWKGQIIIPSGEISPCVRTPDILSGKESNQSHFGTLNYFVLVIYLLLLVGLGVFLSKNQHTTEDFFKGGNRIPWWAAGLSIFGTQLSAITFMAIPAKTFATDWLYFFLMITIIMVAPFIIRFFLPFYRRFNLTTAYEYLEMRFNLATRLIGSVMYILLQLGRLGIVLLLPSLALSVVTGIDVEICILTMGLLSILYTVLGGIEAVIWTDVLQVVVLLGGALLSLVILFNNLDMQTISMHISDYDKMRIFDTTLSFSSPTLWVVLLGGFAANLIQYGSDQTVIQRYLTTKDEKSAAKSIWTGAWMTLPSVLIFFTLGTLLFVYYKANPVALNPTLDKTDAIFPWYIVSNLPDGISGILIAAIFAASMSSLDSSMNSVSTVITTDFFRRLRPVKSEKAYLQTARITTAIVGILGTGLALMMANWGIASLWDQFNMIIGLFTGGLGGIFLLGIFTKKANGIGAITGLLVSGVLQYLIKEYTDIHLLLYAFTGMFISVVVGYLVSLLSGTGKIDEHASFSIQNINELSESKHQAVKKPTIL